MLGRDLRAPFTRALESRLFDIFGGGEGADFFERAPQRGSARLRGGARFLPKLHALSYLFGIGRREAQHDPEDKPPFFERAFAVRKARVLGIDALRSSAAAHVRIDENVTELPAETAAVARGGATDTAGNAAKLFYPRKSRRGGKGADGMQRLTAVDVKFRSAGYDAPEMLGDYGERDIFERQGVARSAEHGSVPTKFFRLQGGIVIARHDSRPDRE